MSVCCHFPVLDPQPTTVCRESGPDLSAWRECLSKGLDYVRRTTYRGDNRSRDPPADVGLSTDVSELPSTPLVLVLLPRHSVPVSPSTWLGPAARTVCGSAAYSTWCPRLSAVADTRRKLGNPKKGFKLVPPRRSGMISSGQLECPSESGLQGRERESEVEGGERERLDILSPRRNSARVLHSSWRRLANAGCSLGAGLSWPGRGMIIRCHLPLRTIYTRKEAFDEECKGCRTEGERLREELVRGHTERGLCL